MASSITRFDIENLDENIVQQHRGSKQVRLKQLGSKQVGLKQLGHKQVGFKQLGPGVKTGWVKDGWMTSNLRKVKHGLLGKGAGKSTPWYKGGCKHYGNQSTRSRGSEGNVSRRKKRRSKEAKLGNLLKYKGGNCYMLVAILRRVKCGDKYGPGQRCITGTFKVLEANEDVEESFTTDLTNLDFDREENAKISLHAILGKSHPTTMKVHVYSSSMEQHKSHVEQVLKLLHDNRFFAKLSKYCFRQEQVVFLGHLISSKGVSVEEEKILTLKSWPIPSTVKEVRGFLGLTGYYRCFVRNYRLIAQPLTALTKKDRRNKKADLEQQLVDRDDMIKLLRQNLQKAQDVMRNQANQKRRELTFQVGDYVFLKIQLYRQKLWLNVVTRSCLQDFFGPYRVKRSVGPVAYELELPPEARIHPVFYISMLKPIQEATWETYDLVAEQFPTFCLEDKTFYREGSNDKDPPLKVNSRRKDHVTAAKVGQLYSIFRNWLNPLCQITR
nr:putative mitochondrial protein [Tanacetum cinerariifolium]